MGFPPVPRGQTGLIPLALLNSWGEGVCHPCLAASTGATTVGSEWASPTTQWAFRSGRHPASGTTGPLTPTTAFQAP